MGTTPQFIASAKTPTASIANVDGVSFKTVYAPGASGGRIDSLSISNADAANPYTVQLAVQKSTVDYVLGEVVIPAGAGTNGSVKSVAALNPTDIPGLIYTEGGALFLEAGAVLRARSKTAVSGVNQLHFIGVAGDF